MLDSVQNIQFTYQVVIP